MKPKRCSWLLEIIFCMLISYLNTLCGKMSVEVICPFLIQLFVFLLIIFKSYFYILHTSLSSVVSFKIIFNWRIILLQAITPICGLSSLLTLTFAE